MVLVWNICDDLVQIQDINIEISYIQTLNDQDINLYYDA